MVAEQKARGEDRGGPPVCVYLYCLWKQWLAQAFGMSLFLFSLGTSLETYKLPIIDNIPGRDNLSLDSSLVTFSLWFQTGPGEQKHAWSWERDKEVSPSQNCAPCR